MFRYLLNNHCSKQKQPSKSRPHFMHTIIHHSIQSIHKLSADSLIMEEQITTVQQQHQTI